MSKPFFLGKAGQVYGPYDRTEIEALRETGEYEKYTWFWDQDLARWQPIDPPPAAPRIQGIQGAQAQPQAAARAQAPVAQELQPRWNVSEKRLKSISALCHDQQNVVSGTLANVTDAGCEFIVSSHSSSPEFQIKLPVSLHLLDLPTRRSMNVSGRIGKIDRRDGAWVYRIHWKNCPQLLTEGSTRAPDARL